MKYNRWDKVNLLLKIFYLWLFLFLFPYPTWLNDLVLVISKAIYYRRIRCSKHAFLVRRKSCCSMLVFQILLWKKYNGKDDTLSCKWCLRNSCSMLSCRDLLRSCCSKLSFRVLHWSYCSTSSYRALRENYCSTLSYLLTFLSTDLTFKVIVLLNCCYLEKEIHKILVKLKANPLSFFKIQIQLILDSVSKFS